LITAVLVGEKMTEEQYKILSTRQISQDAMVWQTPALATAAQAFLLAAAFSSQTERVVGLILSGFSLAVGMASIQLMMKHRFIEVLVSRKMEAFETSHIGRGYSVISGRYTSEELAVAGPIARISSYQVWQTILIGFCVLAFCAFGLKFMDP
jgi:hypothetical protein